MFKPDCVAGKELVFQISIYEKPFVIMTSKQQLSNRKVDKFILSKNKYIAHQ